MTPPYSSLPNTRPRISSPLTYELTFNSNNNNSHHAHLLEQQQEPTAQEETTYSAKSLALYSLIDALLFINLARTLTPYIQPHLTQLLTTTSISASFSELSYLIPILALLKALSGLCLLYTGSRLLSYSARCLLLYTLLSGSLYLSSYEYQNPSRSSSLAIATLTLLLGSIVICLPLLRLTHLLLELEDQQQALHPARHHSNHLPTKSTHPRKSSASSFRQSNKLLPQARYQHLMNPF
ncbi:hypothetical protein PGT21_032241 [Puccinia graminis f. sp. tritici]|uniref:Uncharacterized protein n=1 Tax=Puccinia graminis f. sp. tritici TaxID=56615 RepID=A0A5B0PZF3_PUCGR|nr:hypothetical protein PGT21_032241 [Puccinia graminis f. sp. tritici]KAA1109317.1 hypothetical protein PGTUg99_028271 [Puccinia graminis f. sp. tritici]